MGHMKHTPEPWGVDFNNTYKGKPHYMVGVPGERICVALTGTVGAGDDEESKANARRIVACVNACRDIDMTVLEMPNYSVKAELDTLDAQIAGRLKAESQRDELLAALKEVVYCSENFGKAYAGRDARDKAKALIKRIDHA